MRRALDPDRLHRAAAWRLWPGCDRQAAEYGSRLGGRLTTRLHKVRPPKRNDAGLAKSGLWWTAQCRPMRGLTEPRRAGRGISHPAPRFP